MEKGKGCCTEEINTILWSNFPPIKNFFLNIKKQKMVLTQHQLGKSYLDLKSAKQCILPREECAEADPAQVRSAHAGQAAAVHMGPRLAVPGWGGLQECRTNSRLPPSLYPGSCCYYDLPDCKTVPSLSTSWASPCLLHSNQGLPRGCHFRNENKPFCGNWKDSCVYITPSQWAAMEKAPSHLASFEAQCPILLALLFHLLLFSFQQEF